MKLSVVTAVRNGAGTIGTCLGSVGRQAQPRGPNDVFQVEHVVEDGASTDGTVAVAERGGRHVRVFSERDRSLYDGMNKGIRHATGEVIGTLNADDFYFRPGSLAEVANAMADSAVSVCHGNVAYVDAGNPARVVRVWRGGPCSTEKLRRGWMPPHPTFFVRRDCYEHYGLYREDLGTAADYELMLRFLLKHGVRSVYVPELWVAMRTGGASNATLSGRLRANRMDRRAWSVNGLRPSPLLRLAKPVRKLPQYARIGARGLQAEISRFLEGCQSAAAASS